MFLRNSLLSNDLITLYHQRTENLKNDSWNRRNSLWIPLIPPQLFTRPSLGDYDEGDIFFKVYAVRLTQYFSRTIIIFIVQEERLAIFPRSVITRNIVESWGSSWFSAEIWIASRYRRLRARFSGLLVHAEAANDLCVAKHGGRILMDHARESIDSRRDVHPVKLRFASAFTHDPLQRRVVTWPTATYQTRVKKSQEFFSTCRRYNCPVSSKFTGSFQIQGS